MSQDFQNEVAEWADQTFPAATPRSIAVHISREADELRFETIPPADYCAADIEAADLYILLCHYAHKRGISLEEEARRKMAINRARTWQAPDKDGVVEHVREKEI